MEEKIDIAEKLKEGYVRAILIEEVLGKPPSHVSQTLKVLAKQMDKDKNLIVLKRKIYRPKKVKGSKELFTSFMEIEVLIKGFQKLLEVCFDYMPSSIEVIEPAELKFSLADANAIANDLASRLHKYDSLAKKLSMENQVLQAKLLEMFKKTSAASPNIDFKVEFGKREKSESD